MLLNVPAIPCGKFSTNISGRIDNVAFYLMTSDCYFFIVDRCKNAVKRIRGMRELYAKIHDLKEETNELFNYRILVDLGNLFVEFVYFSFVTIVIARHNVDTSNYTTLIFFWFCGVVVKVVLIVYVGEVVSSTFKKTGVLVHRLFSTFADSERETTEVPT